MNICHKNYSFFSLQIYVMRIVHFLIPKIFVTIVVDISHDKINIKIIAYFLSTNIFDISFFNIFVTKFFYIYHGK